jgi:NAD(P)-dependent dehydrogenase (short-subunit alcohol dehydrogenase family)
LQFQINTLTPFQLICGFLPELRKGKGRVTIIEAGQARASLPCGRAYGSRKAALADSLRAEISVSGVKVSVIEPGAIRTRILHSSIEHRKSLISACRIDMTTAEYYRQATKKSFTTSEAAFRNAIAPEKFAEMVVGILESFNPKPRYLVGREAKRCWRLL